MANRTFAQIVENALARASEVGGTYPSGRGILYQRAGMRQRQLYARANKLNPERFGACLTSALSSGLCDLNDVVAPVPMPDLIQRVEVSNAGSSGYAVADIINIVTAEHQDATLAPRAMIRDGVVIGIGSDLTNVTSIKVFYAKLPEVVPATAAGGSTAVDLVQPWDVLLELDLTTYIIKRAPKMDKDARASAIALYAEEEKELLGDFDAHVVGYTPLVSQFLAPRVATRATS